MASSFSFESLCEDLQAEICACIASSPQTEVVHRLHLISKTVKRLCEEPLVLRRASLTHLEFNPWYSCLEHHQKHDEFLQRCFDAGNPQAIYRFGVIKYFHFKNDEQEQGKGLQLIADAAEKGVEEAFQLYGMIQICVGSEDREKVYQSLSAYTIDLIPSKVLEVEERWETLRSNLTWIGGPKMLHLSQRYIPEECKCDGLTSLWFTQSWPECQRFDRFLGMPTSRACNKCMWHAVLQLFFKCVREM